MTSTTRRLGSRALGTLTVSALLVTLAQLPASAAPNDITGLSGSVGDHASLLTWTGGGTGATIVRDVTGISNPTPTDGTAVTVSGTTARDRLYTNLAPRTYAVWASDSDATTSAHPATVTVPTVAAVPSAITLQLSRSAVRNNQQVAVLGTLTRGGVPSAGVAVDLISKVGGTSTSSVLRQVTSDANGDLKAVITTSRTLDLSWHFAGDAFSGEATSPHAALHLQPTVTGAFSSTVIKKGQSTAFKGRVDPGLPDAVIKIQRQTPNGYGTLKTLTPDSNGSFSWVYTPGATGRYSYRAVLPANAAYNTGISPTRVLEIDARDLVKGDKGDDVLALEKKLASLHYSPGKLDGTFDANTYHAVVAYEKLEKLPRNGTWSDAERAKLGHYSAYKLRYATSGREVEVDITRQVLIYAEGGQIKMIVDTSTGGEYRYTYEGGSDIAHTPRGNFAIQHKIDGVRMSKLGYLYRPSYFTGGFAVHGEGYDVPTHPASHGCVRITDYNTDILYSKLVVGTPVHVFDE